ncbi:AfsR/SARP family transcriptional regulator [Actinocrispum wychmicini]|uniref:AfsR/SARP family transcriptional regulator n=1 Tax=Actinocrispum wychmicini TaxID=1213861 RepID=UPI002442ED4C|nr:winged helix-turn-helix domain-containing protein [Actinocrispum wychmicini]
MRQRSVLVVLAIDAERVVTVEQLVDRVWGERPPASARSTLYSYLSRLRRVLAGCGHAGIVRRAGGYVLTGDPLAVDLHRYRHLVTQARAAQNDAQALSLYEQARALWRGEAFAGIDTFWINRVRDAPGCSQAGRRTPSH